MSVDVEATAVAINGAVKIVRACIRAHIARGEPDKVREELERIVQLLCCCVFLLKAVLLDFYDTEQL